MHTIEQLFNLDNDSVLLYSVFFFAINNNSNNNNNNNNRFRTKKMMFCLNIGNETSVAAISFTYT